VVFWVVVLCNMVVGNWYFRGCAAFIFKVELKPDYMAQPRKP